MTSKIKHYLHGIRDGVEVFASENGIPLSWCKQADDCLEIYYRKHGWAEVRRKMEKVIATDEIVMADAAGSFFIHATKYIPPDGYRFVMVSYWEGPGPCLVLEKEVPD